MPVIAASGNGTHPSTKSNIRNNSGFAAGNFTAGLIKGIGINTLADDRGQSFGSKVVANDGTGANTTDRAGVSGALAAGTLAYNQSNTQWLMYGVGVTTKLNSLNSNALFTAGADDDGRVNNFIYPTSGTFMYGSGDVATFDFYANPNGTIQPNYTKAGNAGQRLRFVRPSGNGTIAATDEAATPTRAVPGELTYRFGGANPINADYKSKETFET